MGFWSELEGRRQGRADRDPGGPGPQPEGPRLRHPQEPPGGDHGALGLRQEQPRLRHALRRGTAPLRREPVAVGAPVPRADGPPRGRVRDGAFSRDRDRAAHDRRASALHGGDGHRDLRSPAPAVRDARPAALPALRRGSRRPERRRDGRAARGAGPRRRGRDRSARSPAAARAPTARSCRRRARPGCSGRASTAAP